jgi:ketosteroid isomerase-like protein
MNKMKNVIIGLIMLTGIAFLPSTSYAQASSNQQTTDEIIGFVKAEWAAEIADPSNVAEQFKNYADDYTEFDGDYATRIDGKSAAMKLAEPSGKASTRTVAAEMLNAKVQVYGDVAILSYNFAGILKDKDGVMNPSRAKSTRVYAKLNGKWKLVHANFAPDPLPKN